MIRSSFFVIANFSNFLPTLFYKLAIIQLCISNLIVYIPFAIAKFGFLFFCYNKLIISVLNIKHFPLQRSNNNEV